MIKYLNFTFHFMYISAKTTTWSNETCREQHTIYQNKAGGKKRAKGKIGKGSVKNVERIVNRKRSSDNEKQRNENQIRNIKASIDRESRNKKPVLNPADQIICVGEMTKSYPFVKSVKHIHGIQNAVVTH